MHETEIIAIDDGYFPAIKMGKTTIASVMWRRLRPLRVSIKYIDIDGTNGTDIALSMLREFDSCRPSSKVLLDGIAYAGFNYIDPVFLKKVCGVNFIVTFVRPLEIEKVRNALLKNFTDWEKRFIVFKIARENTKLIRTSRGRIFVYTDIPSTEVDMILSSLQIYSTIPEPLRFAHFVASETSKFLRRHGKL